ncbi:MAG TPA: hypothetical protein VK553_05630 [Candidatus Nitrosopolaris rasttigaisensis]|nr:hypothetical protein [Candidatus Nitrosopolaris rasttigaisensis]
METLVTAVMHTVLRGTMKRNKEQINSESHFSDPARIKEQREIDKPVDGKNSPWDFRCPQYDQRSSNFINAGTHYGVGINQPVGHKGNPVQHVPALPQGRVNTMRIDEVG